MRRGGRFYGDLCFECELDRHHHNSGHHHHTSDDAVMAMVSLFAPVVETIKDIGCPSNAPCMQDSTSYNPGCIGGTLLQGYLAHKKHIPPRTLH